MSTEASNSPFWAFPAAIFQEVQLWLTLSSVCVPPLSSWTHLLDPSPLFVHGDHCYDCVYLLCVFFCFSSWFQLQVGKMKSSNSTLWRTCMKLCCFGRNCVENLDSHFDHGRISFDFHWDIFFHSLFFCSLGQISFGTVFFWGWSLSSLYQMMKKNLMKRRMKNLKKMMIMISFCLLSNFSILFWVAQHCSLRLGLIVLPILELGQGQEQEQG